MRRALTGVCLGLALLMLTGCSGVQGYPKDFNTYNTQFINQLKGKIFGSKDSKTCEQGALCGRYFECTAEQYNGNKQACRNEIVGELLLFVDLQYNDFRAALYGENVAGRFLADALPLGASASGVLVTTQAAKNTMAAIATGVGGLKASYEKTILFDQLMPALIVAMDAKRKEVKARIDKGLGSQYTDYSLPQAISDINEYFLAGTLPEAINTLTKGKTAEAAKAEKTDLPDKLLKLQTAVATLPLAMKTKLLQELLPAVIKTQRQDVAFLKAEYGYTIGAAPGSATDVSGALSYVLTLVTEEQTYQKVSTVLDVLRNGKS